MVIGALDVGGAESHLLQVLPNLCQHGFEPRVYALTHRGVLADEMERGGVPVTTVPAHSLLRRLPGMVRKPLTLLFTTLSLWWVMVSWRPRVAHFFLPTAYLLGGLCSLLTPVPYRLMSRRSRNHYQQRYPLLTRIEKVLHQRMDRVVGNSKAVMQDLEMEGVSKAYRRLLYNGIDLERFSSLPRRGEIRDELGIDEKTLVLIIVANLIPYKGHADLIAALGEIAMTMQQEWCLLCVGRDQALQQILEQQAMALQIMDNVRFLGQRRDVERLLSCADIGLLVSHEEGFSNSLLEAMACGLPMVVTDVGGNGEVVESGVSGYVVPPHEPGAIGEAILKLAHHPARRSAMGAEGKALISDDFTLDDCVERYVNLYEEL